MKSVCCILWENRVFGFFALDFDFSSDSEMEEWLVEWTSKGDEKIKDKGRW